MNNYPSNDLSGDVLELEKHSFKFLLAGGFVIFFALLFRNMGLYAFVSDEYSYSQLSRLLPLTDATVPIYLYLGFYRITNYCGDGFLGCVRLLNVFLFALTIPFIYGVARTVASKRISVLVALLAAAGPINSYTAYFMPETAYFLGFWALTWFILRRDTSMGSRYWVVCGCLLAMLMLIKPHAIFILPAVLFFAAFKEREAPKVNRLAFSAGSMALLFLAFVAVRLLLGFAIAGRESLTLFGSVYGAVAESASSSLSKVAGIFKLSPGILVGHVQGLAVLYGVPIAATLATLISMGKRRSIQGAAPQLSIYSFLVLGSLLATTVLFTASVVGTGPHETANRLHLRYYSFALPLLMIVAASQLAKDVATTTRRRRMIIAVPIGLVIGYCMHTRLAPFAPNFIDSPDFIGLVRQPRWFFLISVSSLLSLFVWIWDIKSGARCYLFAVLPLSLVALTMHTTADLRTRITSDPYVNAGIFARQYLSEADVGGLIVVGPELGHIFRTLLYLDRPRIAMDVLPAGKPYASSPPDQGKRWVLRIGDGPAPETAFFEIVGPGFALSRLGDGNRIDFKDGFWPGIVRRATGLYGSEPWGAWSSADSVTLDFAKPLPDQFSLHLVARASSGSAGKPVRARVGTEIATFVLGETFEEKVLTFKNPEHTDRLVVEVPPPSSGQAGLDDRSLSVAFSSLRITRP